MASGDDLPLPSGELVESYEEFVMKLVMFVRNHVDDLIEHLRAGDYYSARFLAQTMASNLMEVAKFCTEMIERGSAKGRSRR